MSENQIFDMGEGGWVTNGGLDGGFMLCNEDNLLSLKSEIQTSNFSSSYLSPRLLSEIMFAKRISF